MQNEPVMRVVVSTRLNDMRRTADYFRERVGCLRKRAVTGEGRKPYGVDSVWRLFECVALCLPASSFGRCNRSIMQGVSVYEAWFLPLH